MRCRRIAFYQRCGARLTDLRLWLLRCGLSGYVFTKRRGPVRRRVQARWSRFTARSFRPSAMQSMCVWHRRKAVFVVSIKSVGA